MIGPPVSEHIVSSLTGEGPIDLSHSKYFHSDRVRRYEKFGTGLFFGQYDIHLN